MIRRLLRSPVKREGAERYVLITLVAFAASVVVTRLYLELTGYPQIGNSDLHIAHVLWGGLFLFLAALLPLIFANRWVYTTGAALGGIGVGLFIDEVGKFITQTNDYFFPAAAPIIYAVFLLTVLLYGQIRRPAPRDSRSELYRALDQIMEVIEHDLDLMEREELDARLRRVIAIADVPEHRHLAEALLAVLHSDALEVIDRKPTLLERSWNTYRALEARFVTRGRFRTLLALGLFLAGSGALLQLAVSVFALTDPDLLRVLIEELFVSERYVRSVISASWYLVLFALEGAVGLFLVFGGALLIVQREQTGTRAAYLGLLLSLTTVNLLVFYFNQFAAVSTTLIQFALLFAVIRYRRLYLGAALPKSDEIIPQPAE